MAQSEKDKSGDGTGRWTDMEALVAEHETALLRYATRLVNNPFTAQDVVQNVFIKLFKNWEPGMQASARLRGWLYRVTHNEAVDHIRKESRRRALHERHTEEKRDDCPDGRHCPMSHDERRHVVLQHLRELDEREQQVVLLRLEEGLSYKAISDATGRTVGNVGNILHHAVRKLSERLRTTGVTS